MKPVTPGRGRPSIYPFAGLKIGDKITVKTTPKTAYDAARKWAWRNAKGRKFKVRPVARGTLIERTE